MKFWIGPAVKAPAAAAPGDTNNPDEGVDAADRAALEPPPKSRRDTASAAHANGAAAGASPLPPEPSQSSSLPASRDPWTVAAGAVMAGAEAAAGAAIAAAAAMGAWLGAAAAAGRGAVGVSAARWEITKVFVSVEVSAVGSLGLVATGASTGAGLTTGALRESRRGAALFLSVVEASSLSVADSTAAPRADLRGWVAESAPSGRAWPPARRTPEGVEGREVLGVEELSSVDPAAPGDPVVSAAATAGSATTAAPIPNATAKAPTRPT